MYLRDDNRSSFIPFLAVSLIVHFILIFLFSQEIKLPKLKEDMVEVIPLVEKNGQYEIADIDKPASEARPAKAKLLGMYDSSVPKETVSSGIKRSAGNRQLAKEKDALKKVEPKRSIYDVDKKLFAIKSPVESSSERKMSRVEIGGLSSMGDYFPDYNLGQHTYLNVLRYPDVEYFVRMKRQFKMTFDPVPALRNHFSANRVTQGSIDVVLAVSVGKDGNLSELFILKGSGIDSYDREAMRTVKASEPFASPPKKFLADDGFLRMSWTFTVYL